MKIAQERSPVSHKREDKGSAYKRVLGSYKVEQRQIMHKGRAFHFVSYEGQTADVAKKRTATAPAWYLMNAGTRWEVMPQLQGQDLGELDQLLLDWLERTIK